MEDKILQNPGGVIVDRRLAGGNKSIGNRQRFLERYKVQIKEAVRRAIDGRNIRDIAQGEQVNIPQKDLNEPVFRHAQGGRRKQVHPGNEEYVAGDRIERQGGGSGRGTEASDSGEGEDDFIFHLSKEEFMKVFFDDLELPNLIRTTLAETPDYKSVRAGLTTDGTPMNLHLVNTLRRALGRVIAFGKLDYEEELKSLTKELLELEAICFMEPEGYEAEHADLEERIAALQKKIEAIPYLDTIDLRYRNRIRVPIPTSKAVMFCLMDVSGSMDEDRKDLAKRFFILLYLFLTRHYEKIELVFIRHHTEAEEVSEEEFFHSRETGGTMVSTALELMHSIIQARYADSSEWNIYGAQASDGDNWHGDSSKCVELLAGTILPLVRYFAYVQVAPQASELWNQYEKLAESGRANFAMRKTLERSEIYPVFRELFQKKEERS